jgi:hypothetical protein
MELGQRLNECSYARVVIVALSHYIFYALLKLNSGLFDHVCVHGWCHLRGADGKRKGKREFHPSAEDYVGRQVRTLMYWSSLYLFKKKFELQ